jgi:Rrf2 family nitric oxide-sensitive transcriptional repressor
MDAGQWSEAPRRGLSMRLRLHTDYALRVLLYLGHVGRRATADEMAEAYGISKDHLTKVIQELDRHGFVRTQAGRNGGARLVREPASITVGEVVEKLEGRAGVLDCVEIPDVCPLEPGCRLRRLMIDAEAAFFDTLSRETIASLLEVSSGAGGIGNLRLIQVGRIGAGP